MDQTQAEQPDEIEVTLRHSSFDDFAFRATYEDLPSVIDGKVDEARAATTKRKSIAAIDQEQQDLQQDLAECDERIAAANTLNDTAHVRRETEAKAAIQRRIDDLATQRAALG